jgi:hypothetical protein
VSGRSTNGTRRPAAAVIGALAVPALILLLALVTGGGAAWLLAARVAGAVAFSALALIIWVALVRGR